LAISVFDFYLSRVNSYAWAQKRIFCQTLASQKNKKEAASLYTDNYPAERFYQSRLSRQFSLFTCRARNAQHVRRHIVRNR